METISIINEDNKHNKFRENVSPKKRRVNLTASDLNDLSLNRMLNDNVIQTLQQMLKIPSRPSIGSGLKICCLSNYFICPGVA